MVAVTLSFSGCAGRSVSTPSTNTSTSATSLAFDNSKWNYDKTNNVYWQIEVTYCSQPAATAYETMGIYVPGAYMTGSANSDGTYTCAVNSSGKVGSYAASTAPIVFPVNTPAYAAQAAPSSYSYSDVSSYMKAGFVYVCAGMRGRANTMGGNSSGSTTTPSYSSGAPWGVTDLKAAIRYYRYNKDILPGDTDRIFTFGMSGGGAQSAIAGASGDSALYIPYLKSIGAAMTDANGQSISDAICGAMCWCPITSLDYADEAYEWNMGQYFTTGTRATTTFTAALSKDLAAEFATYVNKLGLKDSGGAALTLTKSASGIYASGSYYDYLLSEIQTSLNNFLSDTKFPYTETTGGAMPGMPRGGMPSGSIPSGSMPSGGTPPSGSSTANSGKTYNTAQDYIDSLNSDGNWIAYDSSANTAKVTSIEAFVTHCKNASKSVAAFDDLSRSQAENSVFGNGSDESLHFDSTLSNLLAANATSYSKYADWKSSYVTAYADDLKKTDSLGSTVQTRLNAYNPMYYISSYYSGYKTSTPAAYWRIRTGIDQGDTALTVEANLMLALDQYPGVKNVDFATVWGQGHTMAERTGDSTTNFIQWVEQCVK